MDEWKLYVRDADRARTVEVDDFQSFELVPRFNHVGAWVLDLDNDSRGAQALTWGRGIIATLDDETLFSGPVCKLERRWSKDGNRLVVSGHDDLHWLAARLVYPEAPALTTATDAYDVRTGVCSTVLREYVDVNAGPSAHSTRRVAGLTLAADPALGTSVTGRGRFQPLDDLLRSLALAGGDLGFKVVQSGTNLEFRVYQPADKTATVIFSEDLGNLREFTYQETAPEGNFVVVGGGGEGTARTIVSGGDSDSIVRYGRHEVFRDRRDTTDNTELVQSRDEELEQKAEKTALSLTPVDTGAFAFREDYNLGDKVTAIIDGSAVQDVIREVRITLSGDGVEIVPSVGTPGEADPRAPRIFDHLRSLERRLRDLERRR